jgi:Binding-prot-dependent transport system membrane comp, N-term
VLRRLLAVAPVMLVVATVTFILLHLAPGDPASVIAGPYASADDVARLRRQLGLDEPLLSSSVAGTGVCSRATSASRSFSAGRSWRRSWTGPSRRCS